MMAAAAQELICDDDAMLLACILRYINMGTPSEFL